MSQKIVVIFGMLYFLSGAMNGQVRIELNAPDTLPFLVEVNGRAINVHPCVKLVFDADTSGKCVFGFSFPSERSSNFEQSITLKKNTWTAFDLTIVKGAYKFVLGSESSFTPRALIEAPNNDTIPAPGSDEHLACDHLAGTAEFEFMIEETRQVAFESRKLEVMKKFFESYCVRCEQLRFMIAQYSQEDYKLSLIQAAIGHLADPMKLHHLADDFFLERNKQLVLDIATAQSSK